MSPDRPKARERTNRDSRHTAATVAAAVLGFFVITLDATIVNVALSSIRDSLGGGITGLQWVGRPDDHAADHRARPGSCTACGSAWESLLWCSSPRRPWPRYWLRECRRDGAEHGGHQAS